MKHLSPRKSNLHPRSPQLIPARSQRTSPSSKRSSWTKKGSRDSRTSFLRTTNLWSRWRSHQWTSLARYPSQLALTWQVHWICRTCQTYTLLMIHLTRLQQRIGAARSIRLNRFQCLTTASTSHKVRGCDSAKKASLTWWWTLTFTRRTKEHSLISPL